MADPETLAALKRAYADTILNTTKEAAARVLCSEKKARRYQQEIVTVRDEAVSTLLRLKQMYDSKVKETEMMSLKQQQKVEELEAQLGEAEDIVGELRMELRELRDELNKVTSSQTYLKSDHQEDSCRKNSDAAVSSSHERFGAVGSCNPVEQTRINSIKRCSSKHNMDRCHHTLPSILTKRREVEGCTQIIHAVDTSMANGVCTQKVSSSKSVETLEMSGCADATDSMVSQNTSQKDFGTPIPLKTSPNEHETPVLAVNKNRCIKYTFKRKRKKEVLNNLDGDSSFEESRNMKQKTGEKDDSYLESLKPSFTGGSSRDIVYV